MPKIYFQPFAIKFHFYQKKKRCLEFHKLPSYRYDETLEEKIGQNLRLFFFFENQFRFMPGSSSTKAIFLLEKTRAEVKMNKQNFYTTFVDLEKANYRILR